LLERGMSADEIVKVIQAGPRRGWCRTHSSDSAEV
jgi:hypothetical protein